MAEEWGPLALERIFRPIERGTEEGQVRLMQGYQLSIRVELGTKRLFCLFRPRL
jgi:hypothetical protein